MRQVGRWTAKNSEHTRRAPFARPCFVAICEPFCLLICSTQPPAPARLRHRFCVPLGLSPLLFRPRFSEWPDRFFSLYVFPPAAESGAPASAVSLLGASLS